jgi:hypothetical protein
MQNSSARIKRVTTSLLIHLTAAIATKVAPFLRPSWTLFGIHLVVISVADTTAFVAPPQSLSHKLPGHSVSSSLRPRQRLQEF